MSTEIQKIQQRLSALEVNVGRLVQGMTGIAEIISRASNLPTECGQCGNNPEGMNFCEVEGCPQGKDPKPEVDDD